MSRWLDETHVAQQFQVEIPRRPPPYLNKPLDTLVRNPYQSAPMLVHRRLPDRRRAGETGLMNGHPVLNREKISVRVTSSTQKPPGLDSFCSLKPLSPGGS
jgi:hypothetical protein